MSGITAICVGGPLGGKVKHILYGRAFMVEEHKPLLHRGFPLWDVRPPPKLVKYVLQGLTTRHGDVWEFWVPEGQTERETLELLLTTYETATRKDHHHET